MRRPLTGRRLDHPGGGLGVWRTARARLGAQRGGLVGGLYGVAIGGLFAGESMFHRERDASKVALVGLVERFFSDGDDRRVIDTQWATAHLASLGVQGISRQNYLDRLALALQAPDWVADPARR